MAIFIRSSEYGDGGLIGMFGTINLSYAGRFGMPALMCMCGSVYCDNTISELIHAMALPNAKTYASASPSEEVHIA